MNHPVEVTLDTYTLPNGYECTLTKHGPHSYDVDMWTEDGSNHWNKWFNSEAAARVEFDRWRT